MPRLQSDPGEAETRTESLRLWSPKGGWKRGTPWEMFSRLDGHSSGLVPASAVEGPTTWPKQPKLLGAERSADRPGERSPSRRTVPKRLTAPTACRGPRRERIHSSFLAPPKRLQGPSGGPGIPSDHHPCGQRTTSEHPVPPREGNRGEECAEAPEREAHPLVLWTSGMREVRVTPSTMHRRRLAAPVIAWQPAATDGNPASNLQRVIEVSSRWRHGHQRQVRANPPRVFQTAADACIRGRAESGSR